MGNQADTEVQDNTIGEVELALVAGEDTETGETVPILAEGGVIQALVTDPDGNALTDALGNVGDDNIRVSLEADNLATALDIDIEEIGGQAQSAVDVADAIDQIEDALQTTATDELRSRLLGLDGGGTLQQVNVEAFDTALSATDFGIATYAGRALNDIGQDELVSRVTDSTGSQVDPATNDDQPNWFDDDIVSYDLVGTGDYTIAETNVRGTGDVIIKVSSADAETFTVTLEWTDGSGNVLYSQSPAEAGDVTDANLKFNVGSDNFQLTITDTSGAGQNNINGTVNFH